MVSERVGGRRGDWAPRFFPFFRSLYFSLALHHLNAWNRLQGLSPAVHIMLSDSRVYVLTESTLEEAKGVWFEIRSGHNFLSERLYSLTQKSEVDWQEDSLKTSAFQLNKDRKNIAICPLTAKYLKGLYVSHSSLICFCFPIQIPIDFHS